LEGARPAWFAAVKAGVIELLVRHVNAVPTRVKLGLHFCYGSAQSLGVFGNGKNAIGGSPGIAS
jgi:hypothetical protein